MDTFTPTGVASPPANPADLLNRLLDEAERATGADAPPPSASPVMANAEPAATPVSGNASPLGSLLGNPALLAALPTLAENLGPLLGSLSGGTGSAPTATRPHTVDRHTALLCAVKPYLSPHRQEAAETVIRLCRVWDALERSGISLSGLLSTVGGAIPATRDTTSEREVT
ncbi:MAG: hypothetical protein IJX72_07515 [Clostridia bacterium]|nr:hypothetical protein [Clostridia bacterium]